MLVLVFFLALFSFAHTTLSHLELNYDWDDTPLLLQTFIKPYYNSFFSNFTLPPYVFVYTYTYNNDSTAQNYTLNASKIRLQNLVVNWDSIKLTPVQEDGFSVYIGNAIASVCFDFFVLQNGYEVGKDNSTSCILSANMTDFNITARFMETPPSINSSAGFNVFLANFNFTLDPDAIRLFDNITENAIRNLGRYLIDLFAKRSNQCVRQWKEITTKHLENMLNNLFTNTILRSSVNVFKQNEFALNMTIGCPKNVRTVNGNTTKNILKIPADFKMGWKEEVKSANIGNSMK